MSGDLNDLLAAWLGHDFAPERCEELLSRLRTDEGFRKEFVAEVRMYGMLRTVQAAEPRWLCLEDMLGWSEAENDSEATPEEPMAWEQFDSPRPRRPSHWLCGVTAAAATILAMISIALDWSIPQGGRSASGIEAGIPNNAFANGRFVPPPPPPRILGAAMRHVVQPKEHVVSPK